jgi:outer membrane scaffolding protein for murein synthesis (MipA/OmpV family)
MARAAGSRELFWRQAQKCFQPQHFKFEGDRKQQKLSRLKPVKSAHTIGLENTMRIQTGSIETEFAHGKKLPLRIGPSSESNILSRWACQTHNKH